MNSLVYKNARQTAILYVLIFFYRFASIKYFCSCVSGSAVKSRGNVLGTEFECTDLHMKMRRTFTAYFIVYFQKTSTQSMLPQMSHSQSTVFKNFTVILLLACVREYVSGV